MAKMQTMDEMLEEIASNFAAERVQRVNEGAQIIKDELDIAAWNAQADQKMTAAEAELTNIAKNDQNRRNVTQARELFRAPIGDKVVAVRGARVVPNPETGENIFYEDRSTRIPPAVVPNPEEVSKQMIAEAGSAGNFNLRTEMEKIRNLKGDDLERASTNLMFNIQKEISKRRRMLEVQADVQSGFLEAEKAYQERQRVSPIYPTERSRRLVADAQQRYNQAAIMKDRLLKNLESGDAVLAELTTGFNVVQKIELRKAAEYERRQATAEAKKLSNEDRQRIKREEAAARVSPQMHQNARYLMDSTVTGDKEIADEKIQVLERAKRDKDFQELITITPQNIYTRLASTNRDIRKGAMKILVGHDKQRFPDLKDIKTDATPYTKMLDLQDIIDDPAKLVDSPHVPPATKKILKNKFDMLKVGGIKSKDAKETLEGDIAQALQEHIQGATEAELQNAKFWASPELKEGTVLRGMVDQLGPAANFADVAQMYMKEKVTDVNGQEVPMEQKRAILMKALADTIDLKGNTFLVPNMAPIKNKMLVKLKGVIDLEIVRRQRGQERYLDYARFNVYRRDTGEQ